MNIVTDYLFETVQECVLFTGYLDDTVLDDTQCDLARVQCLCEAELDMLLTDFEIDLQTFLGMLRKNHAVMAGSMAMQALGGSFLDYDSCCIDLWVEHDNQDGLLEELGYRFGYNEYVNLCRLDHVGYASDSEDAPDTQVAHCRSERTGRWVRLITCADGQIMKCIQNFDLTFCQVIVVVRCPFHAHICVCFLHLLYIRFMRCALCRCTWILVQVNSRCCILLIFITKWEGTTSWLR
jgi:hypothetical protein